MVARAPNCVGTAGLHATSEFVHSVTANQLSSLLPKATERSLAREKTAKLSSFLTDFLSLLSVDGTQMAGERHATNFHRYTNSLKLNIYASCLRDDLTY